MLNFSIFKLQIIIIILLSILSCTGPAQLKKQIREKQNENIELLILFTDAPIVKNDSVVDKKIGLYKSNFMDEFSSNMPHLVKESIQVDSVQIVLKEKFPFISFEKFNIKSGEEIDIYYPDMNVLKQLSNDNNIVLIFQEMSIFLGGLETQLALPTRRYNFLRANLVSGGIFSIWNLSNSELLDYGKFVINVPVTRDRHEMWISLFKKLIKQCLLETSLVN